LINATLGLFNLIPGFPLDGGRVFRAIVWGITKSFRRATLIAANVGRLIAFLFILFGVWQMFGGNFIGGLWIAFIGWFLESAANAQVQQQNVQDLLAGHTVSQAMNRSFTIISADTTLQQLADEHIFGQGRRFFVVMDGEELDGLLTLHRIKGAPQDRWNVTTVAERMIPADETDVVDPDMPLVDAMKMMDEDGVNQLPVMKDGRVLGVLSRESLVSFLRTLQELGLPPSSKQHLTPSS
jgi:CBS domain-containing protein